MRFKRGDDGASLVEFAVIMPLLLLLVLGIIEFGFLLAQMNEIRHAAREGARYAAVSRPDYDSDGDVDNDDVLAVTCDAVNLPGTVGVTVTLTAPGGLERGKYATITVEANTESLSNVPLISGFLPDTIANTAEFRLEQDATWTGLSLQSCP